MSFFSSIALALYGILAAKDSIENYEFMERNKRSSVKYDCPTFIDLKGRLYFTKTGERVYKSIEHFIPKGSNEDEIRYVLKSERYPHNIVYRYLSESENNKKKYLDQIEDNKAESIKNNCEFFRTYVNDSTIDYDGCRPDCVVYDRRFENINNGEIYSVHVFYDSSDKNKIGYKRYGYKYWAYCNYNDSIIELSMIHYKMLIKQRMHWR